MSRQNVTLVTTGHRSTKRPIRHCGARRSF